MTAQVIPFGGYQLCSCGQGVAVIPIIGATVCQACFDARPVKNVPAADIFLIDPDESPALDDLLAKLTKAAP